MGIAYLAQQDRPIKRQVALKLIKLGMDTKQVIDRFEAERQVLALMDHPNIAKVLDAGMTGTGRPFFVMERVEGTSLIRFCDQNELDIRERLNLFIAICHAVQHAHQHGIIHRDIKPSNILVTQQDGRPHPKVIDFGIAKAINQHPTDKTLFTSYSQMIGTPEYMSPEQADMGDLDIDTRTDVFSLGALLYELLTGVTPFHRGNARKKGHLELQRLIREEAPRRPSTRLRSLELPLDEIASNRKTTPESLGKRLQADLDWIVMKALEKDREDRYESVSELGAEIKRYLENEPVLAGPPSGIYRLRKFWQINRDQRGPEHPKTLTAQANVGRMYLFSSRYDQAEPLLTQAVEGQIRLLGKSDPSTLQSMCDLAQLHVFRSDLVQGRALSTEVLELARQSLGEDHPIAITAMRNLVWIYIGQGNFQQAALLTQKGYELSCRTLGRKHEDSLFFMVLTAWVMEAQGLIAEATPIALEAWTTSQEVLGEGHWTTTAAMNQLGSLYTLQGRFEEAKPLLIKSIEFNEELLGPAHTSTLYFKLKLVRWYRGQSRLEEMDSLLADIIKICRQSFPENHSLWGYIQQEAEQK